MIKDRIKKIYELSIRGKEGERETASRLLEVMLKKYQLTIADLLDETTKKCEFKYRNDNERRLILQCVSQRLGHKNFSVYCYKTRKKVLIFDLTVEEYVDINTAYMIYLPELLKHLEIAFHAFIQANSIAAIDKDRSYNLTEEDKRALEQAELIPKTSLYKRLVSKN